MTLILSLLFLAVFIKNTESKWFLVSYALFLLIAQDSRIFLNQLGMDFTGRHFFCFYGNAQAVCMALIAFFFDRYARVFLTLLTALYGLYSSLICWMWGDIPLTYYDDVSLVVLVAYIIVASYGEKGLIRNVMTAVVTILATIDEERFL